jgi:hypothetical protein
MFFGKTGFIFDQITKSIDIHLNKSTYNIFTLFNFG